VRATSRNWDDFHCVAGALERLVIDARFPLVRRLVHAHRFCTSLERCKWKRIDTKAVAELVDVLERAAPNEVGELFRDRQPPSPSAAKLFRRLAAHFIRCVPGGRPIRSWRDHWRAFRFGGQLARANTTLPDLHPAFPKANLDQLESALGPLADDVRLPLDRFFETHAISKRYALAQSNYALTDSFRRLAFTYPMGLWMLRWLALERQPTADDMVQIVVALERGFVLPALNSAARYLSESGELERLIAWYGR
jgi:hypothetical protein